VSFGWPRPRQVGRGRERQRDAIAGGGSIAAQVYGVGSRDPAALAMAASVLSVATASAAVPALRAVSLDPTKALRAG
jgi:hypothetical protein